MTDKIVNLGNLIGAFNEIKINEYKVFYKEHLRLLSTSKRLEAIEKLSSLHVTYTKKEPGRGTVITQESLSFDINAKKTIKDLLGDNVLALFTKTDLPKANKKEPELPDNIILGLLVSFALALNDYSEKIRQEWNYRTNFIAFLIDCLREFGLHPNILLRAEDTKRFNICITHYYRSRQPLTETKFLLSEEQFNSQFTTPYSKKQPIKCVGKLIPFDKIHEVKITTTLLKDDELELFASKHRFRWSDAYKDVNALLDHCLDETERYHPNPFELDNTNSEPDKYVLEQTLIALKPFPASQKLFRKAIKSYFEGTRERNILDDMRLSLELLLKKMLVNEKSLENQTAELGKWLKLKKTSPELRNMFGKLVEGYTRYQNTYVKHDDNVPDQEIALMIDLSNAFIKHIVSL